MNITYISFIILVVICLILSISAYRKKKDFFHPQVFIAGYFLLTNIVYLHLISVDPENFPRTVSFPLNNPPERAIFKYIAIQIVYFIILYISMATSKFRAYSQKTNILLAKNKIPILFYLTLIVSISCFVFFLLTNGGLTAIILLWGTSDRGELVRGSVFFHLLFVTLPILAVLNQYMYSVKKIKKYSMILILLYLIFVSMMNGGRGGVFVIIISSMIAVNYIQQTVQLRFFVKYAWILILLVPFFTMMVNLRNPRVVADFVDNPMSILTAEAVVLEDNLARWRDLSRADIQIFIIDHFSHNDFWYGSSFKNILFGFIPRSLYPNKPAIDEGIYIRALAAGFDVGPNMPSDQARAGAAWPSRTIGTWFANFGILGVLLAAFIKGKIYMFFYRKVKANNFVYLLLYPMVLLSFFLSVSAIVSLFISIVSILVLVFISKIISLFTKI